MDLPFELVVNTSEKSRKLTFFNSEKDAEKEVEQFPKIKEFDNLSFEFSGEDSVKLYISELDDYDLTNRIADEFGQLYFIASQSIIVYSRGNDSIQPVPLVPGFYYLRIEQNDKKYFSGFQIVLKDLEDSEWNEIKTDIENKVIGLSVDYIKRKNVNKKVVKKQRNNQYSFKEKINYLLADIPKAMISLEKLKKEAKFKIEKIYSWQPIGSKALVDYETIKRMQERPDKRGFLYSPQRTLIYDVIDNQWLKYILTHLTRFCKKAEVYLESILIALEEEYNSEKKYMKIQPVSQQVFLSNKYKSQVANVVDEKRKIKNFNAYIQMYLKEDFLTRVKATKPNYIPKSLVLDPKYNNLYKIFLRNIKSSTEIRLEKEYEHYWKRTDLLYEIWCYIKVVEVIIADGYEPEKGWIFNQESLLQPIPFLKDGTSVYLRKNNTTLRVVFNETLPKISSENSINSPLKTVSNRNKPDIRIDIIINTNEYTGSIILDAKYKKLINILYNSKSNKQVIQLREYRNSVSSSIIDFPSYMLNNIKAIESVFAIYPSNDTNKKVQKSFDEEGIYFSQLKPGFGQEEFSKNLLEKVDARLKFYNEVKN